MADLLTILKNRKPAEAVLAAVRDENMSTSLQAGQKLVSQAKDAKLSLPDYLRLAVDPNEGAFKGSKMDGFECALAYLNLPVRDDYSKGILLQAAADTFQTFPGTRALFPAVIDNVLQWKYTQDQFENVENLIAQSRTINGVELISTVVEDQASDYQQTGVIAEGARIPIRSLRTSEKSVRFYKFGGGWEFTYEFERRASLDLLTPYAARMQREVSIGEAAIATSLIINGDGTNGAAPVVNATDLAAEMAGGPTQALVTGKINWEIFLKWLVTQAKTGKPIDTISGNWDMYFEWIRMFATPTATNGPSQIDILAKAGVQTAIENPRLPLNLKFALSSTAPEAHMIGFIKGETLEELVENGSEIEESIRAIENQKVRYVKTENKGYRLIFPDTRTILNLNQ